MKDALGVCLVMGLAYVLPSVAALQDDDRSPIEERHQAAVDPELLATYDVEVYDETESVLRGALVGPTGSPVLTFNVVVDGRVSVVSLELRGTVIRSQIERDPRAMSIRSVSPAEKLAPVTQGDLDEIYRLSAKLTAGALEAQTPLAELLHRVLDTIAWADPLDEVLDLATPERKNAAANAVGPARGTKTRLDPSRRAQFHRHNVVSGRDPGEVKSAYAAWLATSPSAQSRPVPQIGHL